MSVAWQAVIVALLAAFVGVAELVSRYKSEPLRSIRASPAAWFYILLNAGAGAAALMVINAFGWSFGQTTHVDLWRIFAASFGAIAFFRSSLFQTRIGNTDVGIGPSLVLGALLDAADREVDRRSAGRMSAVIRNTQLGHLNANQVNLALPVLCLALMQNFSAGDQAQMGTEIEKILKLKRLDAETKMRAVVIQLSKYLSVDLVESVLKNADPIFRKVAPQPITPAEKNAIVARAREQQSADVSAAAEESDLTDGEIE